MIKVMLKRTKENDTYLAADSRHRRSPQIAIKVDKVCSFEPALQPSSAEEEVSLGSTFKDLCFYFQLKTDCLGMLPKNSRKCYIVLWTNPKLISIVILILFKIKILRFGSDRRKILNWYLKNWIQLYL